MENIVSTVYQAFLAVENPEPTIQKQVFNFGVRTKNQELLATLAKVDNLLPEIDEALRDQGSAVVKAAWASRKGRSQDDLVKLVLKEKRIKVLTALAERSDLPQEVYKVIAEKSNGQGSLNALVLNQDVELEHRSVALLRLLTFFEVNTDPSRSMHDNRYSQISNILAVSPELAEVVGINSNNISALHAAANHSLLSEQAQRNILSILKSGIVTVEQIKRSNYNSLGAHSYNFITNIVDSMCEQGPLAPDVAKEFTGIIKKLDKKFSQPASYYSNYFADTLKNIANSENNLRVDLKSKIASASTSTEIDEIIKQLEKYSTGNKSSSSVIESTVLAIIASPISTSDQTVYLLNNTSTSWYRLRDIKKITDDPKKIGAILALYPWMGIDSLLGKLDDPELAMESLLAYTIKEENQVSQEILNSRYLTESIAGKLPLRALSRNETPAMVNSFLSNKLKDSLTTAEQWLTFETLAVEYQGSIDDLLHLVTNL